MSDYAKPYGTVNTDAEREEMLADKIFNRLSGKISGLADEAADKAISGFNLDGILTKLANKFSDEEARKPITAPKSEDRPDLARGKVTGPGYVEEFSDWRQAIPAYETLKKRMLKQRQAGLVKFFTESADKPGKWVLGQKFHVNEDAFE